MLFTTFLLGVIFSLTLPYVFFGESGNHSMRIARVHCPHALPSCLQSSGDLFLGLPFPKSPTLNPRTITGEVMADLREVEIYTGIVDVP